MIDPHLYKRDVKRSDPRSLQRVAFRYVESNDLESLRWVELRRQDGAPNSGSSSGFGAGTMYVFPPQLFSYPSPPVTATFLRCGECLPFVGQDDFPPDTLDQ